MKIYVAGKFGDKDTVREAYQKLSALGHSVSYDWTTHKNIKPYDENKEIAREYAGNEMNGILACDAFIYFSAPEGHTLFMELGMAIGLRLTRGKPAIFMIGKESYSPWMLTDVVTRVDSLGEAIQKIQSISRA